MRLCTLEAGPMIEPARQMYGSYPSMIETWLTPALPGAEFSVVSPIAGEALPEVGAFDGYIITGSRYGAYEDLPWMEPLRVFLRVAKAQAIPVFGICFGHQIMAQAHGARVEKSETGWAIGSQTYAYSDQAGREDAPSFVFHQDQVEDVPEGATVVGASRQCPIGALAYSFPALSVQYHPEFVLDYVKMLVDFKESQLPAAVTAAARQSLEIHVVDNRATAQWVAKFFTEHLARE